MKLLIRLQLVLLSAFSTCESTNCIRSKQAIPGYDGEIETTKLNSITTIKR